MARGEIPITDRLCRKFSDNERKGEDELREILVIRDDGSKILVQEIRSDIKKLEKIRITELDENGRGKKVYNAYTEDFRFDYIDGKSRYADWVGEMLLSKERLDDKEQKASQYGLSDIYVGYIRIDIKGKYIIYSQDDNILPVIAEEKRRKAHNRENTQKNKLLARIFNRLKHADINQLKDVLRVLEREQSRGEHGD